MTPTPEAVFALVQDRPGAVWLDGGAERTGWSILAWAPTEIVTDGASWPESGRRLGRSAPRGGVPFAGGVLGYVGYGAGHRVETVPAEAPTPEPEVWLGRFEGGLCFDHRDGTWHPAGSPAFVADAVRVLAAARPLPPPPPAPRVHDRRTVDPARYAAHVRRILALIAAGDCYQVNLTRPVHLSGTGDPWAAWRRLRAASSADRGAFLRVGDDLAILSNSPETLLEVHGRALASRPIKGTRPRAADPERDLALAAALDASEKDRAELMMIVDLVRNDLGRVAVPGTVRTGHREITAHANVFHAAVEVTATLDPGHDAWSALAAVFPPGSVTGAPKVRACQRIAEIEAAPRGVYCGAIGYVADGGDASWSVAIRTAVAHGDTVRYHVGGGVVADSDPEAEWMETVHKGTALEAAFASGDPDGDVAIRPSAGPLYNESTPV